MSLSGELSTMELGDVLGWVVRRAKSGTLTLRRRSTKKSLTLRQGRLVFCASNDPRETLGQALIRTRLVTEESLFQALLRQEKEHRLLGALLVEDGVLAEEDLRTALHNTAEEVVYDSFLWPDGHFEFQAEPHGRPERGRLDLDLDLLTDEGRHRREQWQGIRKIFPSSEVTFKVTAEAHAVEDSVNRRLMGLAAAGKTLAAISLETRRSRFETGLRLVALCEAGALTVHQIVAGSAEVDPVGTIQALLARAEERLRNESFDDALRTYEEVLLLDGLNQDAKKGLLAVSEGRRRRKLLRQLPTDKIPILRLGSVALTRQHFDPHEGFLLSRINGQWSVGAILKLCPMSEAEALGLLGRLLERGVIELV